LLGDAFGRPRHHAVSRSLHPRAVLGLESPFVAPLPLVLDVGHRLVKCPREFAAQTSACPNRRDEGLRLDFAVEFVALWTNGHELDLDAGGVHHVSPNTSA
jgi:hypothetical protein